MLYQDLLRLYLMKNYRIIDYWDRVVLKFKILGPFNNETTTNNNFISN